MDDEVWLRFHDVPDRNECRRLASLMRDSGLPVHEEEAVPSGRTRILVFRQITPALLQELAILSAGGAERLLVIASQPSLLETEAVWQILDAGASDLIIWDGRPDFSAGIAARLARWRSVDSLLNQPAIKEMLVGGSPAWLAEIRQVAEAARFNHQLPILITGESGTGKELVAQLIHRLDPRPDKKDFIILDCTTVVPELSGSEFFGHEKGAFTGAAAAREGALARANLGTLFLDEVGELSLPLQAELLRAVQEKTYKKIGGNFWRTADFRLICATHRDLMAEEAAGQFRRDFYYRIAGWICRLPALRERPADILPLARHFICQLGRPELEISEPVRQYLLNRSYPGNIRDLKQVVTRMVMRHAGGGPISAGDIPMEDRPHGVCRSGPDEFSGFEESIGRVLARGAGLKEISRLAEETAIQIALQKSGQVLSAAARQLRVTPRALQIRNKQARCKQSRL